MKSAVTFASFLLVQFNPAIIFAGDSLKLFNIRYDSPQFIDIVGNQTVQIPFDVNFEL
jgi:hypothetical protein